MALAFLFYFSLFYLSGTSQATSAIPGIYFPRNLIDNEGKFAARFEGFGNVLHVDLGKPMPHVAIMSFRRRFVRRRPLYSSNGTSSLIPLTLQIILSGVIHPQPGPTLRKSQNFQFDREHKKSESSITINQYAKQSNIKIAHLNIRSFEF